MEPGQDFRKLGCELRGERVHQTVSGNSINKENKMETIILGLMIFSFIIVISIDYNTKAPQISE